MYRGEYYEYKAFSAICAGCKNRKYYPSSQEDACQSTGYMAISMQLKRLEQEGGVPLFTIVGRNISVNDAGLTIHIEIEPRKGKEKGCKTINALTSFSQILATG